MRILERGILAVLICSSCATGQLPSSRCDAINSPIAVCSLVTGTDSSAGRAIQTAESGSAFPSRHDDSNDNANAFISTPSRPHAERFHWTRALYESFTFLAIEQAYVVHDDYRWVVIENGVPFNHYWRDYKQSLSSWIHAGWNDGDPLLYGYLGHPIQGAMTEFIQIQNDPRGRDLELSNTKEYWHSRLRAFLWNAIYSTQWNIGPLSELTVEKYGAKVRSEWNRDGTWPCTHKPCYNGTGQIDLVTTPAGGTIWLLGEDFLDKAIARRVEGATQNHFLIDLTRCALNPIRGGANILHGKAPWYRASRDARRLYFLRHMPPGTRLDGTSESH
jgi:hypothetical protein